MKTTVDLPDSLVLRAKVTAARRRTTLKNLIMEGLERVINWPAGANTGSPLQPTAAEFFETDVYGVPVLKRRGVIVTDAMIEELREQEGI